MRKFVGRIICFCLCFIAITGCSNSNKNDENIAPVTRHVNEEIFGTDVSFTMYKASSIKKIFPKVQEYLKKAHYLLDRERLYNDMNNLATINENYGSGAEILVDELLYDALKLGVELTVLTDGYFNIGAGALSDVWQYYYYYEDGITYERDRFSKYGFTNEDPSEEMINLAMSCTPDVDDYESMLIFNDETKGITFNTLDSCGTNKVVLTLGALGKGFAIERAKEYISTLTDEVFFINAGSSSIVTNGINPIKERDTWNVAIQSPYPYSYRANTQYTFNIGIKGSMAISTSGDTEKYYFLVDSYDEEGNVNYVLDEYGIPLKRHHIINPKTGKPESYWNVITVVSSSRADILDALTTAIYSLPTLEAVETLISKIESTYNIEIEYALQRAKKDQESEEIYVGVLMSDTLQDSLISYKSYSVIENLKDDEVSE